MTLFLRCRQTVPARENPEIPPLPIAGDYGARLIPVPERTDFRSTIRKCAKFITKAEYRTFEVRFAPINPESGLELFIV